MSRKYARRLLPAAVICFLSGCVHIPPTVSSGIIPTNSPDENLYSINAKHCHDCNEMVLAKAQEICPQSFSIQQRTPVPFGLVMIIRCPKTPPLGQILR